MRTVARPGHHPDRREGAAVAGSGPRHRVVAASVGLALAAIAGLWPVGAEAHDRSEEPAGEAVETSDAGSGEEVVVVAAEGDTVWSLALPHAPAGADPHAFVETVATRSGIQPDELRPGDVLRVPTR